MNIRLTTFLVFITLFVAACGPADSDFTEFSTYKSPDGNFYVIIDAAHSRFAFGPETIKVYVARKDMRVRNHIVTTRIANDGGGIREENVKARWLEPEVIHFCLSGAEQSDRVFEINVRSLLHTEESMECS